MVRDLCHEQNPNQSSGSEWCIDCVRHFEWLIVLICWFYVCFICSPLPQNFSAIPTCFQPSNTIFQPNIWLVPRFSRGDIPQGAQFDGCCLNGFEAGSDTPIFDGGDALVEKIFEDHQDESPTYLELVSSFFLLIKENMLNQVESLRIFGSSNRCCTHQMFEHPCCL